GCPEAASGMPSRLLAAAPYRRKDQSLGGRDRRWRTPRPSRAVYPNRAYAAMRSVRYAYIQRCMEGPSAWLSGSAGWGTIYSTQPGVADTPGIQPLVLWQTAARFRRAPGARSSVKPGGSKKVGREVSRGPRTGGDRLGRVRARSADDTGDG